MIRIVTLLPILAITFGASLRNLENRIVGGHDAFIEDFPYQASLQSYGRHKCGASIISSKFILTAAHCTKGLIPEVLTVYVGSPFNNIFGDSYKVLKFHAHPQFNSSILDYDYSIVELDGELNLSSRVKPIALADKEPAVGVLATASGWGTTENGTYAQHLRAVEVPIISREVCRDLYAKANYPVTDVMICAGDLELGGKDSCQQDSGGPLVVDNKQVGVVSWGEGCGNAKYPGVYSSVAKVTEFISSITGINI